MAGSNGPAPPLLFQGTAAVAAGALRLFPEENSRCQEHRGDGRVGEPQAQLAMVHRQRRIQEPNRGAEIPDPVEIATHFVMGCAPRDARQPLFSILRRLLLQTPRGACLFRPRRGKLLPPTPFPSLCYHPCSCERGIHRTPKSPSSGTLFVCRTRIEDPPVPARIHRAPEQIPPPIRRHPRRLPEIPAILELVSAVTVLTRELISTCLFLPGNATAASSRNHSVSPKFVS